MSNRKEYVQRRLTMMLGAFDLPADILRVLGQNERPVCQPNHRHLTDGTRSQFRCRNRHEYSRATYCIRLDAGGDIVAIEVTDLVDIEALRQVLRSLDPRGIRAKNKAKIFQARSAANNHVNNELMHELLTR